MSILHAVAGASLGYLVWRFTVGRRATCRRQGELTFVSIAAVACWALTFAGP